VQGESVKHLRNHGHHVNTFALVSPLIAAYIGDSGNCVEPFSYRWNSTCPSRYNTFWPAGTWLNSEINVEIWSHIIGTIVAPVSLPVMATLMSVMRTGQRLHPTDK